MPFQQTVVFLLCGIRRSRARRWSMTWACPRARTALTTQSVPGQTGLL